MPVLRQILRVGGALIGTGLCCGLYGYSDCNPWMFKHVFMPAAGLLDPETAHNTAVTLAARGWVPKDKSKDPDELHVVVWQHKLDNPVGLAAGFDKQAQAFNGLLSMGFGFVEVGSVTKEPRIGNDRPRVFRLLEDKAVINRYGLNGDGAQVIGERLERNAPVVSDSKARLLGVNIGVNMKDYQWMFTSLRHRLESRADYIVLNVSCPNTPEWSEQNYWEKLSDLLGKLELSSRLVIKISPDLNQKDKQEIVRILQQFKGKVAGLIVSNTTTSRPESLVSQHKTEWGGLSGQPLKELSTQTIRDMYRLTNGEVPIIGVGGVASGQDAFDKISAGATLVQIYTAMVYEGPPVIRRIKTELAAILKEKGYKNINEAVGCEHKNK